MKKQAEDKANEKARQAGELVEAVQDEGEEAVDTAADAVDQAEIPALDLDEVKAENVGITLAKVAVVSREGSPATAWWVRLRARLRRPIFFLLPLRMPAQPSQSRSTVQELPSGGRVASPTAA